MRLINRLGFAITFLTRLPVPFKVEYDDCLPSESMVFYPLVGGIIGLILFSFDIIISKFLPQTVSNILLLTFLVYLTGGIHLDGFIDTMDGIFSSRGKEEILEIMHDSLIGAFGAIAVFLLLFLKYNLFLELTSKWRGAVLIFMPVLSRTLIVWAVYQFPLATSSKLGKGFNYQLSFLKVLKAAFILVLVMVGLNWYFIFPFHFGIISLFCCLVVIYVFSRYIVNLLGGLTGDIYGAINEISEIIVLLSFLFIGG